MLDMGDPIKIVDLAKKMINMYGLKVAKLSMQVKLKLSILVLEMVKNYRRIIFN